MRKSSLLSIFILILAGMLGVSCFLAETVAQDRMPICSPLGKTIKRIKPLREMNWANNTIDVQVAFPVAFRETGRSKIIDSIALLIPILEHLRQVHVGLSGDTVRIVHIGDSHIRGHIYPQTTGACLAETFGVISYIDKGVNGVTYLTFTHPDRITEITALKPELLILSFGANEGHNRRYNINVHYDQMDEPMELLRDSLPNIPILLTTPPGSYESFRQRRCRRTYAINPRTATAAETIRCYTKDHHLLVWDMYGVARGKRRTCTNWAEVNLVRPDHVHCLSEGYILQGNLLCQALMQAYNDYVPH